MDGEFGVAELPLSAGSSAKIHLGSYALEYDITLDTYKSFISDFDKLERQIDQKRRLKKLLPAAELLSVRSYEQDHLNRLVGTSFGYFLDTVRSRWVAATAKLLGQKLSRNDLPLLPLRRLPPPGGITTGEILSAIDSLPVEHQQHRLFQGLSDCLLALMDDVSGPRLVSALWGLTGGRSDTVRYLLDDADTPFRSGFSIITADDRHQPLTTRHLLELFGWREQGNTLIDLGYNVKAVEQLFFQKSNEYQLAFEAWRTVIPQADELVTVSGEEELYWWGKSFPFELFACADLALWPPFEPPGRVSSGFRWYDLNPAKRFLSILAAFRELELPVTTQRGDDLNARLLDLQAKLCERLKWPTPDALAKMWYEYLAGEHAQNSTPWYKLEPEISLRVAGAVAVLRTRIERPADVVLNHVDLEDHGGKSAPLNLFQLPDGKMEFSSGDEHFTEFLLQAVFYEGTAHLYNQDRQIILGLNDASLRAATAKYLARKHADLGDWPEALRARFQEICRTYFAG